MIDVLGTLSRRSVHRLAAFTAVGGLALLAYRELLTYDPGAEVRFRAGETESYLFEPAGGSPGLILAVAAWMLWRRRHRLAAAVSEKPSWVAGTLLLFVALALGSWSHYVSAPDLLIPSLMLMLLGSGLLLGGRAGLAAVRLPALVLIFAVPIPPSLLNEFMFPLQLHTARLSEWMLRLLGVPVLLSGDLLFSQQRAFQVIETCSGLRLMQTLAMAAVVYAELLGRGRLHTGLLLLAAPLIGALVNGVRVISIVLNPYAEFSAIHTTQGLVMLVVGVLILAGVDRLLEFLPLRSQPVIEPDQEVVASLPPRRRLLALTGFIGILAITPLATPRWIEPTVATPLYSFPVKLDGWTVASGLAVDETFLGSVRFSDSVNRRYRSSDGEVDLLIGSDSRLRRTDSVRSPKTAVPASGFVLDESDTLAVDDTSLPLESLLFSSRRGRVLVYRWYEGLGSLSEEITRELLALDRGPFRRPGHSLVVRLSTPLSQTEGRAEAEDRLRQLVGPVRAALQELGNGGPIPESIHGPDA